MKKLSKSDFVQFLCIAVIAVSGIVCFGQAFEDVGIAKHEGDTGLKDLVADLDNNFALIESGRVKIGIGSAVTNTPGSGCTNFFRVDGTTLVFVTLGKTNVLDADILN